MIHSMHRLIGHPKNQPQEKDDIEYEKKGSDGKRIEMTDRTTSKYYTSLNGEDIEKG